MSIEKADRGRSKDAHAQQQSLLGVLRIVCNQAKYETGRKSHPFQKSMNFCTQECDKWETSTAPYSSMRRTYLKWLATSD